MATKSFLKNITIKDKKSAKNFITALEYAENKTAKNIKLDKMVENIEDSEQIRKIFSE